MVTKTIFLLAGEPSGDLHGSLLIKKLRYAEPSIRIVGVGGPEMRKQGLDSFMGIEDFSVMGFTDVFKNLPQLYQKFKLLRNFILEQQFDAVIFIDYPGLNLRLANSLRKSGFKKKLIHYISPSVWAWGKNRINKMENTLDLLLTIFPFEKAYFDKSSLKVEYVGNPIIENIQNYPYQEDWATTLALPSPPSLAIFPGSRLSEITRNLPKQLKAAEKLAISKSELTFGISYANENSLKLILEMISGFSENFKKNVFFIPKKFTYELMKDSKVAIAKSGTVTLELALHQKPTVVVYELSKLNYFLAKYIFRIRLPHYCIVNIISNKTVFPELIAQNFSSENLHEHIDCFYKNDHLRNHCIKDCQKIHHQLSGESASSNAATAILGLLNEKII